MKKAVALFLALCLAFAMTACTNNANESSNVSSAESGSQPATTGEKTKITFWSPFSGGDGDIMKSLVDAFNEASDTTEVEFLILKSEEYYTKLMVSMSSNTAPDTAIMHISRTLEFTNDNLIEPLDDLAAEAGVNWSDFTQALQDASLVDGKHYAMPLDTHLLLMHFNKEILGDIGMLDADGIPTMQPGEEGFFNYFNEVKSKVPASIMPISGTSSGGLPQYLWYTLLTQHGGEIQSEDGKTATLDTPENKKALSIIKKMVDTGLWPKNQKNGGEIFSAKSAAATINGNWGVPIFEGVEGLDFVSLAFPQFTDTKAVYADSHTLILPKQQNADPAKQKSVMEFMNWLTSNSVLWANAGHVPSKSAVLESEEFKSLPYRSDYAQSAEYAHFYPRSLSITGLIEVVQRELATMITGEQDVDTTAKNMQEGYQKLLDSK